MAALLAILSVLLIALGATAYAVSRDDAPSAPGAVTTTEATAPAADMGAGTPGAPCATNRLGKTFTKDSVVYTCGGPKPYHWLPPG